MAEIDYITDDSVLLCLGFLWVTQPAHLRTRDLYSYLVIVLCVKMGFFLDRAISWLDYDFHPTLMKARKDVSATPMLVQAIPLVLTVFLENKIIRHYMLGSIHKAMAHSLTVILMVNYLVEYFHAPVQPEEVDDEYRALADEHASLLALIGYSTYNLIIVFFKIPPIFFSGNL